MADHDEEALLHEDLDLDYEVDEELPEDELLGDNDDYILSESENTFQDQQDITPEKDEAHTTITEQEDDILELTEDAGIEEFEDDRFNQTQESDSESTKERGRFLTERTNTSGHTPIVFASDGFGHGEASEEQQPLFTQNYLRGQINKSRGVRGGFRGFRGGFQPRGGRLSNRLGQRFPFHQQQQQGNPNLHILSQNMEPIETKKVLINPHFRGNVQANQNSRLAWDNPEVPPHNMQNQQVFQQNYQNVGNFSSPVMQPQNQPQQFGPMHQQQQLYNNQFPEQFIPQHQIDNNNQGIPPQQQMYPQHNPYQQQPINNHLRPMFINSGQPHIINRQLETPGTSVQSPDWYNSNLNQGLEVSVQQEPFQFKQPMQVPFRHRAPRPMHPRFQQPQTIIRTVHRPQIFNPPNLGYRVDIRPQMYQQQPSYDQQFQQYQPNYLPPQQPQFQPHQHFVTNPEPTHQRSDTQFNRTINMPPRSPIKRLPQKRIQTQYEYEMMNDLAAKKKKSLDFRNLQEVPRIDDVPDTTVFFEDRSPMKYVQEVEEEEDDETKAYRLKIEEQRQLREKILKQKEERRKRAAMEQQQAEVAQGIQCANTSIGSTTDVSTTFVQGIAEHKPQTPVVKPLMQTPVLKPLMQRLPQRQTQRIQPQQTPERVLVPVANTQPSKTRVVLLNQANQNKKSPLLTQKIRQKAFKKQIMPNTVSSTKQSQQLTGKRVVRAIPRQGGLTINTAEASSSSATDVTSAESSDELFDKEHLSQFLSTRTVVPKNGTMAAASDNQVTSTNVFVNGAIASTSTMLKTRVIKINNLAASTNELKIRKMCKGVGNIQTIQMSPNLGQAVIRFKSIGHAHNFYKKYQRKMVDLSLIDVKLIPPP